MGKSFWSKVGDVVGAVKDAPGDVASAVGNLVGDVTPSWAPHSPTPTQQGVHTAVDTINTGLRAGARTASLVGDAGAETLSATVRSLAAGKVASTGGGGLYTGGLAVEEPNQIKLGNVVQKIAHGERVDLGSGFFASGKVAEEQAAAARRTLTIDGHAWTPGRALASGLADVHVIQPGTTPYKIVSGLVDGAVTLADPTALALSQLGDANEARRALRGAATAEDVAKAAEKAPAEYRQAMEIAAGLVNGNRRTIVPMQFDRWLYSEDGQNIVRKITETTSAAEIRRLTRDQLPVSLTQQLARSRTEATTLAVLRDGVGADFLPDTITGYAGVTTRVVASAERNLRVAGVQPSTWLPFDDPERFIKNLDDSLGNANVKGDLRDAILNQAFDALTSGRPGDRKRLLDVASTAVEESLKAHGVDETMARQLTAYMGEQERLRHWYVDGDTGRDINFSHVGDDLTGVVDGAKPVALVDLMNSGVHLYDQKAVRDVRRMTSQLRALLELPGVQPVHSLIAGAQDEIWKASIVMRGALFSRQHGEALASAMASGKFDNTIDYLHFFLGKRGAISPDGGMFDLIKEGDDLAVRLAEGELDDAAAAAAKARLVQINDELALGKTTFDEARLGAAARDQAFGRMERSLVNSGDYPVVHKLSNAYEWREGMADRLIRIGQDPVYQRVANGGLFDGDRVNGARPGLDGVVDWLLNGTGAEFRRKMEAVHPEMSSQQVAQSMVDIAQRQIRTLVGDEADLRAMLVDGKLNGATAWHATRTDRVASDELLTRLAAWRDHPDSPTWVPYPRKTTQAVRVGNLDLAKGAEGFDTLKNLFWGAFGKSGDALYRSPTFRASAWGHMETVAPYLTAEAQTAMLDAARASGLSEARLGRLEAAVASGTGEVTLAAGKRLADARALDDMARLFDGGYQRSNFMDMARALYPFGDVWKNFLVRWGRHLRDNPQVFRRGELLIEGARGAGFFYSDPTTGQEVYKFPLPGPIADQLGVQWKGSVKGLSLGLDVTPGVGPVGTIALSEILKHSPLPDDLVRVLLPYGTSDDVGKTFIPGWMKKTFEGIVHRGDTYANAYAEVFRQLAASGDYDLGNPREVTRLDQDARSRAGTITLLRGAIQFFAPSSPQVDWKVPTYKGDRIAGALVKDFAKMRADEDAGKIDSAVGAFTDKYGTDAFVYMSGKTRSEVGGQQASKAYGAWEQAHKDLIDTYPAVAGYFGPQGEGFDWTVYTRQQNEGNRSRLTPRESLAQAEATLGWWVWQTAKDRIGAHPTPPQQTELANLAADIRKELPGWNPDSQSGRLSEQIAALEQAAKDPQLDGNPTADALSAYMDARSKAFERAKTEFGIRSRTGPMTSNRTRVLRDELRDTGEWLSKEVPEFKKLWRDVLSREMKDDLASEGASNG